MSARAWRWVPRIEWTWAALRYNLSTPHITFAYQPGTPQARRGIFLHLTFFTLFLGVHFSDQ